MLSSASYARPSERAYVAHLHMRGAREKSASGLVIARGDCVIPVIIDELSIVGRSFSLCPVGRDFFFVARGLHLRGRGGTPFAGVRNGCEGFIVCVCVCVG